MSFPNGEGLGLLQPSSVYLEHRSQFPQTGARVIPPPVLSSGTIESNSKTASSAPHSGLPQPSSVYLEHRSQFPQTGASVIPPPVFSSGTIESNSKVASSAPGSLAMFPGDPDYSGGLVAMFPGGSEFQSYFQRERYSLPLYVADQANVENEPLNPFVLL